MKIFIRMTKNSENLLTLVDKDEKKKKENHF